MSPMPHYHFRCTKEIWERAEARARDDGLILSGLLREWLDEYGQGRMARAPRDRQLVQLVRSLSDQLGVAVHKL